MNRFNFFVTLAVALCATGSVYAYGSASQAGSEYAPADNVGSASNSAGEAAAYGQAPSSYDNSAPSYGGSAPSYSAPSQSYGAPASYAPSQNIPYSPVNTRGNTVTSSITYPQNKGEILIHRPAAIIVKRPPTKVLVNHPPLVVKPAPVVLHKPPAVVMRKVYVKQHPRPVKVEPVYVNVVKPPAEKYFVNEKQQQLAAAQLGSVPVALGQHGGHGAGGHGSGHGGHGHGHGINWGLPASASSSGEGAAANAGYQLLGNQGLAALAGIAGPSGYAPQAQSGY